MNDRELLELAAKAAGIEIEQCTCRDARFPFKHAGLAKGHWSPLYDDGDALRLAVRLEIDVQFIILFKSDKPAVRAKTFSGPAADEQCDKDQYAATRRAIVRAAAEIGKAMP